MIEFFNINDGFSMVILTAALVFITWHYANLTKKLLKNSSKTIRHEEKLRAEEQLRINETKLNYIYLLNAEIYSNSEMYVMTLYYLKNSKKVSIIDRIKALKLHKTASVENILKLFMKEHVKSNYWDSIYTECSKYFQNDLMQELVDYYAGVHKAKIFSIIGMSNEHFIEFAKNQLTLSMKCIELMRNEGIELRGNSIYDIDDIQLIFDSEKNDIVEINK